MKELGVFINPHARKKLIKGAKELARETGIVPNYCPSSPTKEIVGELPRKAILVGGDGFVRACIEEFYKREELGFIVVVPGGTTNLLYHSLIEAGKIISPEEFLDADKPRGEFLLRPGTVEKTIFMSTAGFGGFEEKLAVWSEKLRNPVSKRYNHYLSGITALVTSYYRQPNSSLLDFVFTGPSFSGLFQVSQEQKLHSELLERVVIAAKSRGLAALKFITALLYWKMKLTPPKSLINIERAELFLIGHNSQGLNLDGGPIIFTNKPGATYEVKRHKTPIPIAALKL